MLPLLLAATLAAATPTPATVTVQADQPGLALPADFVGLSTEKKLLTRDCFHARNTTLINLCRTLGPGVLRIGANNVDSTFFRRDGHPPRESMQDNRYVTDPRTIGPESVDDFFAFARAAGWKVIYGVNLGAKDPAMAADEADYALQVGAKEILAIEIGNEPNLYPKGPKREGIRPGNWGYPQYKAEFTAVADAIVAKRPQAPLTGPAVTKNTKWMPLFMADFKGRVALATSHVYPLSAPETDPQAQRFTSIEKLLGEKFPDDWATKLADAQAVGVPYRVAECNTASGGGKRGVSNAFASALWSIDFLFDVATRGGQGVNLHGSFTANNYSPIVYDKKTATYGAAPLYYGLLFFSQAAQGRLVSSTSRCEANFVAHATRGADGKLRVTLLNKDLTRTVEAQIDLGGAFKSAQLLRLAAPGADATEGVTFAGAAVTAEGKWTPRTVETISLAAGRTAVTIPSASAALLIAE
ncbi:MAG: hypothetical protein RL250_734 [Verrucomicrobiota bacterium]|jgi:hypothetical protein